jgi:hypothetical protein
MICCSNCRFWLSGLPSHWYGECHRHTPQFDLSARWPITSKVDWCGEYEMRDGTAVFVSARDVLTPPALGWHGGAV